METQGALLSGVSVGLTVAAPIGPMAVIVIRRTISGGFLAGLVTGAGASTIHVIYATLALCGIDGLSREMGEHRTLLTVVTALMLAFFAIRIFQPRQLIHDTVTPRQSLLRHYASALAFNSVNPLGFALILGAMTTVSGASTDPSKSAAIAGGVFAGSFLWWVGLVTATATVGTRASPRVVRSIDIAAGSMLLVLAISAVSRIV